MSSVEAKSLEIILNQKNEETIYIKQNISEEGENSYRINSLSPYCQELNIHNVGSHPVLNFFPSVNNNVALTVDDLIKQLASEEYPLLTLYHRWTQSIKSEATSESPCHPLDLLNFKPICTKKEFKEKFISLCHQVGIEIRQANVLGSTQYDFGIDQEWSFLDLERDLLYLGLNNEKLVSSEEIMDDPFIALRTKFHRKTPIHDLDEAWNALAHFNILEPASANLVECQEMEMSQRALGYDLYPNESIRFKNCSEINTNMFHQKKIEHTICFDTRKVTRQWTYSSPVPVKFIANHSDSIIYLVDRNIKLKPNEIHEVDDSENLFAVNIEFSKIPKGTLKVTGYCSALLFPSLVNGENKISLGTKENQTTLQLTFELNEALKDSRLPSLKIINTSKIFDYVAPQFELESIGGDIETMAWQIGFDPEFQLIPSNFDQIEPFTSLITIPLLGETFFNPDKPYYFRVKGCRNGQWSTWSEPFKFVVNKPAAVEEVEFDKISDQLYELNWERRAEDSEEPIEYLVFGSNSLDFIPSIYTDTQINGMIDGKITDQEFNSNYIATTKEAKIQVKGDLAYYRIIAKKRGQLSVPSDLIRVYDIDLIQPRNVLQIVDNETQLILKRLPFRSPYPWSMDNFPLINVSKGSEKAIFADGRLNLGDLKSLLRAAATPHKNKYEYEFPEATEQAWEEVKPYLIPANHPAWPKLNRIFCNSRATLNSETFKKAGFIRPRPGRFSRVSASSHPECKEYFIKAYCDCELGILYDWRKWIHRIRGAEFIRSTIKEYRLQNDFKVPHKWIYPLPKYPEPPKSSKFLRKNFILVVENMRIEEHSRNEKLYKSKMSHTLMDGLYTILQVCGLNDSVYVFNIPFCKDGKMAIIDTEYHHKWPVPFHKLTDKFSKEMRSYWTKITFNGGKIPNGKSEYNPPRMDRRDIPEKKKE